jgi:ADP-heptose:LPS heptosyltransferase
MSVVAARPAFLVVRTDSAAGLVCTLPLLRVLRDGHPSAWIGVLTQAALAPLVAAHLDVNEAFSLDAAGVMARVRLLRALRARRIDEVIVADAEPARRVVTLARRMGARRVSGIHAAAEAMRQHESDRVMALGEACGVRSRPMPARLFPDSGETMHIRAGLAARSRDLQRPIVAVHVGCTGDAERWPPERFAALMRRRYEHDGAGFLLLWTPADSDADAPAGDDLVAREVHTRLVGVPCLRWPVRTQPALLAALAECDSVIASLGDVAHLAAAVGRPVMALAGACDVPRWRPLGVAHELARAPSGRLADVTVDQAFAACEVLAARVALLAAG